MWYPIWDRTIQIPDSLKSGIAREAKSIKAIRRLARLLFVPGEILGFGGLMNCLIELKIEAEVLLSTPKAQKYGFLHRVSDQLKLG